MTKAVIFDLDGTLLDTSEGVIQSVKYTISALGYEPLPEDQYRTFIGPPIHHRIMQIYGVDEEQAKVAMYTFRNHYPLGDMYKASHYEGMNELLKNLKADGLLLGVCTYKREDQAKILLENKHLASFFEVIHGQDSEGKMTKAEVLQKTLADLGVNPDETVMVGDAYTDAEGAAEAGVPFLGVTYGFGFRGKNDVAKYPNIGAAETTGEIRMIIKTL
ncbi:MAG: HAD-IA family hydrolase [Eubacterium sp.]|nr:HAD-IA family hydrolase [Eubacterium sp.]